MSDKNQEKSFEEAFQELETLAGRLENGDVPLEESIKMFEEGMALLKLCTDKLDAVELRLEKLIKDENGDFQLELMK